MQLKLLDFTLNTILFKLQLLHNDIKSLRSAAGVAKRDKEMKCKREKRDGTLNMFDVNQSFLKLMELLARFATVSSAKIWHAIISFSWVVLSGSAINDF